ncbi:MAG: hypothetical protein OEY63_06665 [Gemmatimonadota bacterium]|nr:hypothetical protein [Gemmatimonadota bacterium]MDH5805724.1 hypothetical protein [Gemmatimonadota bacterium]
MFVPIVPPPPPSPEAEELGGLILEIIDRYADQNPEISKRDVRRALSIASERVGLERNKLALILGVVMGVLALAGVVVFGNVNTGSPSGPVPFAILASVIGLAIVALMVRK